MVFLYTIIDPTGTSSSANAIVRKQEGNYFENLLTYSIKYNRLDQDYQPTDGFINNFTQTLPLYSEDSSFENSFTSFSMSFI